MAMVMMAKMIHPYTVRKGSDVDDDLKKVTKQVIGGAWQAFPADGITIKTVAGGITNLLYKLEGPPAETPVLVRIYGEDTDVLIDRDRDNHLFNELSNMGYAPPYLGRFSNGRIEGYLPARPLKPSEMGHRSPVDFVSLIAKEMARLHGLPVTTLGTAKEAEIWHVLTKWLQLAKGLTFMDADKASAVAALDLDWVRNELVWVQQQLSPPGDSPNGIRTGVANGSRETVDDRARGFLSEVMLCHNDLLSGNVLHADGWNRVQVIDYEYSGYNYRGFDIANHFCEHAGFDSNFAKSYPTAETQEAFLRAYVRAWAPGRLKAASCEDEDAFIKALRAEVNKWTLPAHLWWAVWAIVQARYSPIEFDFVEYARLRLGGYRLHKNMFFGAEQDGVCEDAGGMATRHEALVEREIQHILRSFFYIVVCTLRLNR